MGNIDAAVNKQIFREDQERRTEKEKGRDSKLKMKKGGKGKRSKAHFANKGGKGKFTGNSKAPNRGPKGRSLTGFKKPGLEVVVEMQEMEELQVEMTKMIGIDL